MMIKSIYLSPSTQEKNVGVGNYGTEEYRMNLICDMLQKILEENNIIVYRNRPEWNLQKVVDDSNEKCPDIHLALHSNACNGTARGCEVFCHRFGGEGNKLAELIYLELERITPTKDREIKEGYNFFGKGKNLYELANTKTPSVLVEVAFHDNPQDAEWIINDMKNIADTIAKAVLKHFDIVPAEKDTKIDEAVKILQDKGIIDSPDYWIQNAVKGKMINGEYAAIFIERIAALFLNRP